MALLAACWVAGRRGSLLALVVDHGLRPDSAVEARLTGGRLAACGIASRVLTLAGLAGSRLAERARTARHAALERACADAGILHLLFGHHAADQAETVAMRRLRGSGPAGLAGMAALVETPLVRLLRPLLDVPPVRLRETLRAAGVAWVEDPSNADPRAERTRLRQASRDRDGDGPLIRAAVEAAAVRGQARTAAEATTASWLGSHVTLYPEGYAVAAHDIPAAALAALVATIGGGTRPPPPRQTAAWVADRRAATLGGVRIVPVPGGWRLQRELAAMAPGGGALPAARWDGRFRVPVGAPVPDGALLAAAGDRVGARVGLPAEVAQARARLQAADGSAMIAVEDMWFSPRRALTPPPFQGGVLGMQKPDPHPMSPE